MKNSETPQLYENDTVTPNMYLQRMFLDIIFQVQRMIVKKFSSNICLYVDK